jgi:hypothetical protein
MATYRKFGAKSRRQDKHEIAGYTCMIAPRLVHTVVNYQEFILETSTCLELHIPPPKSNYLGNMNMLGAKYPPPPTPHPSKNLPFAEDLI